MFLVNVMFFVALILLVIVSWMCRARLNIIFSSDKRQDLFMGVSISLFFIGAFLVVFIDGANHVPLAVFFVGEGSLVVAAITAILVGRSSDSAKWKMPSYANAVMFTLFGLVVFLQSVGWLNRGVVTTWMTFRSLPDLVRLVVAILAIYSCCLAARKMSEADLHIAKG